MSLKEYNRKRDFDKTAEPPGEAPAPKSKTRRFVIQKHDASRLHYDFRLELDGTLKSWAVPKGMPFAKGEKHLAVQVEDHPISYIDFEGTIPKGQYGGGTVMVWDQGTFEPLSKAPAKELSEGKLHVMLHGSKLEGEWYLVRLRDEKQWLLIKGGEDLKPVSKKQDDTSAASGRSMKELAKGDRVWQSKETRKAKSKKTSPLPDFVEPMKAKLSEAPPKKGEWIYEIKFDGFRALALRGSDEARLLSRNEKDLGAKFPEIMEAVAKLNVDDAVIDGEIVALDAEGRSSFQLLQAYEMGQERPPIYFYAFDLLRLNGQDLKALPLLERKARLEKLLGKAVGLIRYSASLGDEAESLLEHAKALSLEGLIGKLANSHYEVGRRSGSWVKLKLVQEQELVIGGYSEPSGTRKHFGALLVGFFEGKELKFAGKVGTGFNTTLLRTLHARFSKLEIDECPFADLPEKRKGRYGQGVTASEMRLCHWVKPELVCQVKYAEWTRDNRLRQPVFLGLREDKNAKEVVKEKAT